MAINLKQEINRTIELKNKVVTAKNNINKVIVRGGGKQSQTLEEVPTNIEGMVKQYSKVVVGNPNIPLSKKFVLKTNADFEIKNAFLFLDIKKAPNKPIGVDLQDFIEGGFVSFNGYSGYPSTIKIKLYLQNKNEIVIEEVDSKDLSWIYLKKFIVTN